MRLSMIAILPITLMAADIAAARDLLSAPVPRASAKVVLTASEDLDLPRPFTTTFGKAGYVCSISGLGRTSSCTYRSWAARVALAERFASR